MDKSMLVLTDGLSPELGFAVILALGVVMLGLALAVRSMIRTTDDYVAAGRRIGLGFGVGSVIAVWTWSVAVLTSAAVTYTWGISGLFWFVVPNGLAIMLLAPFALHLRKKLPAGYTITQFIKERFNNPAATVAVLAVIVFTAGMAILLNSLGAVIVLNTIFGIKPLAVLLIALVIVTVYSYFGGLWTSAITGTINTLLLSIPAAIVLLFVLARFGGPELIFDTVASAGPQYFDLARGVTAAQFGIVTALGLLAVAIADQALWQKVWAIKPDRLARTFLWAGAWFYPIPITVGLLGFVGIALGVTVPEHIGDPAAIGPYVISHIGLPVVLVVMFTLVILNACFSATDGAFAALASVVAVDIVRPLWPSMGERTLFLITRLSIVVVSVIVGIVVLLGLQFVDLLLFMFAVQIAFAVPITLAIFWSRFTGTAFVLGCSSALVIGLPIRLSAPEPWGTLAIFGVAVVVSVGVSLIQNQRFDFRSLRDRGRVLGTELEQRPMSPTTA
ncbi:MAG: sodium:solute symporter [Alphaproteobacteria bacterium]